MNTTKKRAVALGFFDGLHIAHRQVLKAAADQSSSGMTPAVILFDKSPAQVLRGSPARRLMTDIDRRSVLTGMGFELIDMSFEGIVDMSAEDFFRDILIKELSCGFLSCGYNYTFGKGGKGNADDLKELCPEHGIKLSVCAEIKYNGIPVCSSAIRQAVKDGNIKTANAMLGAPLSFSSEVFYGDRRGRLLNAPTANQYLPDDFIIPKFGVYASFATMDSGEKYPSVTNIGNRPTFDGESVRSETYILDFDGDLYGKELRVNLMDFIREEKKFPSFEALKKQIAEDAEKARAINRGSCV